MTLRSLMILVVFGVVGCGPGGGGDSSGGDTGDTEDGSETGETTAVTSRGTEASESGTDPTASSSATTAGDQCDPFPTEDAPCSTPGAFCSSDCSDVCSFCNVLQCEDGVWSRMEVFPFPCIDCDQMCEYSVAAGCAGGAPDQATCVTGCEEVRAGPCRIEFSGVLACIGDAPAFTCDDAARPVVVGCEAEFDVLYECLGI
jgi:hypothetical protein